MTRKYFAFCAKSYTRYTRERKKGQEVFIDKCDVCGWEYDEEIGKDQFSNAE